MLPLNIVSYLVVAIILLSCLNAIYQMFMLLVWPTLPHWMRKSIQRGVKSFRAKFYRRRKASP